MLCFPHMLWFAEEGVTTFRLTYLTQSGRGTQQSTQTRPDCWIASRSQTGDPDNKHPSCQGMRSELFMFSLQCTLSPDSEGI